MNFLKSLIGIFSFVQKKKQERLDNRNDVIKLMQWGNYSEISGNYGK